MFLASDEAARRLGLPSVHIHIHLELGGQLDVPAFKRALTALYHVYPTAAARCEISPLTGRPRWRLDGDPPDLERVVRIHRVEPATEAQLHRQIEDLLTAPIDLVNHPAVRFHVFRGLPRGDVLAMRFAHALMDARGGSLLLEELDSLYEQHPDPATLTSAGDERRCDYADLLAGTSLWRRVNIALRWLRRSGRQADRVAQLAQVSLAPSRFGRIRLDVRRLSPEQTRQVQDNALRVCGFGRFGDFLRACAIQALHRVTPQPVAPDAVYKTLNLINNRKRRQRGPVCWNLTSALSIAVPARLADDRRHVAELIQEQMVDHLATQQALRQFVTLSLLMHAPTSIVASMIRRGWTAQARRHGFGLAPPPSLPLGLMGPFSRPMPTFCGVKLINYYGFATVRPRPGLAVDVNLTADRMNICGSHYDGLIPTETLTGLLDGLIERLLDPA